MPNLTFVLPHWLYWSALVLFPLIAMLIVRRQRERAPALKASLAIGYFLLLTGGFLGLHRFYLRSLLGIAYVPLFLAILYGNVQGQDTRDAVSGARNDISNAEFLLERAQKAVAEGKDGAAEKLAQAEQDLTAANEQLRSRTRSFKGWQTFAGSVALAILVLLVLDAFLLPRVAMRCAEKEANEKSPEEHIDLSAKPEEESAIPALHSRFTDLVDAINGFVGSFVSYWSVIAVFVYYYEVLARYVFNSPTNWAHESMFLMFGMQYLLAGGYALREEAHVRVDVLYSHFSDRAKALVDVFTSAFFFIFASTLAWTGWVFFWDSAQVWEVSFTEWAIQYYPVKFAIPLGAALIFLQGLSALVKDILVLAGEER